VTASEKDVPDAKLEEYIVSWPGKVPKGARGKPAPLDLAKGARRHTVTAAKFKGGTSL
jgi:hypothetical protein